jgi:hypothetical protein
LLIFADAASATVPAPNHKASITISPSHQRGSFPVRGFPHESDLDLACISMPQPSPDSPDMKIFLQPRTSPGLRLLAQDSIQHARQRVRT